MSVHVSSWVFKHSPAEKADRLVLLVLADHANGDGDGARPSVTTIQCEARIRGRSTVQTSLRRLERAGAVESTGAHDETGCTIYRVSMRLTEQDWLDVYPLWEDPREKHLRRKAGDRGTETVPLTETRTRGTENDAPGAQKTASRGTDSEPKPSREPSSNRTPQPPEGEQQEAWDRVVDVFRQRAEEHIFDVWLEPMQLVGVHGHVLLVDAPDHLIPQLRERFGPHVQEVVRDLGDFGDDALVEFAETELERKQRERRMLADDRRRRKVRQIELGDGEAG